MDAKKAAAAYPALEARIRALLVEYDPSGLFGAGAPPDEHDGEVHAIVSHLQRAGGEDDVAAVLADVLGAGSTMPVRIALSCVVEWLLLCGRRGVHSRPPLANELTDQLVE